MKKLPTTLFVIGLFLTVSGGSVFAENLCGITSGNGEVVSVAENSFVLLHNDGRHITVSLTENGAVETLDGKIPVSGLTVGNRVTLIGDDKGDGTFTADAVLVCGDVDVLGAQEYDAEQPASVRHDAAQHDQVSRIIDGILLTGVGLVLVGLLLFLRKKKQKSFVYLFFFTIFYVYLYAVLDYTLLQFQSLLLLQHFVPDLMLRGVEAGNMVNLIPLVTLTPEDITTSLLNVAMMLPFGFGLPFITDLRFKQIVVKGFLVSVGIEALQWMTGYLAQATFRIADINDLVFNTLGAAIGYMLFAVFIRLYRRVAARINNPVSRYIVMRPQV